MATMCLMLNLLGLTAAIAGVLTAVGVLPDFVTAGQAMNPAMATAVFWWVISIVLLLSAIAFGVYPLADKPAPRREKPVIRYERDLPPGD